MIDQSLNATVLSLKAVSLAALVALAPCAVYAAPDDAPTRAEPLRSLPSPDEVVAIMANRLSLTDDQRIQIAPIIADRQQKLKAIFSDSTSHTLRQRRQAREVLADGDKKINALLSPEQQAQYAQLEQQIRTQMKQTMQQP